MRIFKGVLVIILFFLVNTANAEESSWTVHTDTQEISFTLAQDQSRDCDHPCTKIMKGVHDPDFPEEGRLLLLLGDQANYELFGIIEFKGHIVTNLEFFDHKDRHLFSGLFDASFSIRQNESLRFFDSLISNIRWKKKS